ncbi:MAG: lysylphosphatidylglycerol synthase transmembrane domain-containing protein [Planctomycetota bacterium]
MQKDSTIQGQPAPGEGTPAPLRLWSWHTFLGIAVAVALLVGLAYWIEHEQEGGWAATWARIRDAALPIALLGALCHYATYPVRGLRWRRTLAHLDPPAGGGRFGLFVFFYNAVDNVVPGKLGDLYAAHLLRINLGIRRSIGLGSIVFLRMIDAWVILGLAAAASFLLFSGHLPETVFWALILGGLIAVAASLALLTFFLWKHKLPAWMPEQLAQRIRAFQSGMWPGRREYLPIAVLTVLIWALELAFLGLLALSFGIHLDGIQLVFLASVPLLASAFPLTPSGAGVVELTLYGCLVALGVPAAVAVSIMVLNRLLDYWLHLVLGLLTWIFRRKIGLRSWREVAAPPLGTPQALEPAR